MPFTLISTTASERLLRHVQSLSEAEAEDALRLLVRQRERVMSKIRIGELCQGFCRRRSIGGGSCCEIPSPARRSLDDLCHCPCRIE